MALKIKKATREEVRARVLIEGPTKGGKTYTGLRGLCCLAPAGKRLYIDSEAGRSKLFIGRPNPDHEAYPTIIEPTFEGIDILELEGDYQPETYIQAIRMAQDAEAGYECMVIDGLSQEWAAVLGEVDKYVMAGTDGGKFGAWAKASPRHAALVEAILQSRLHIIATVRTKMTHVLEVGEDKKNKVKRVGLQAVQRDDLHYEFDVEMVLTQDHVASVVCRFDELDGEIIEKPGAKFFLALKRLLSEGAIPIEQVRQIREAEKTAAELRVRAENEAAARGAALEKAKRLESIRATQEAQAKIEQATTAAEREAEAATLALEAEEAAYRADLHRRLLTITDQVSAWKGKDWKKTFLGHVEKIRVKALKHMEDAIKQLTEKQAEHEAHNGSNVGKTVGAQGSEELNGDGQPPSASSTSLTVTQLAKQEQEIEQPHGGEAA